jgi:hypothetical protein
MPKEPDRETYLSNQIGGTLFVDFGEENTSLKWEEN